MILLLVPTLVFILTGCEQKPQVRHYTQITIQNKTMSNPHVGMGMKDPHAGLDMSMIKDPHAGLDMNMPMGQAMPTANDALKGNIAWDVPKGWVEKPGGPMRLATFQLEKNPKEFDCSIVALPGDAGGLEANIKRWLGQIQLNVEDQALDAFIKNTKDGVYDFSTLQSKQARDTQSMIAAMLNIEGTTVFIKLKGTLKAIDENRGMFVKLVQSVRKK